MQIAREVGFKRIIKYGLFTCWQAIFDLLPFSPLRIFWLKVGGANVGVNTVIDKIDFFNLDRTGLTGLTVGQRCFIGRDALLDLAGKITLEDWVTVSPRVTILSHLTVGFLHHPLLRVYPSQVGSTRLQSGCFIGVNATILHSLTIGHQAVVAAGSVVTTDIPPKALAAGSPAQIKKHLP